MKTQILLLNLLFLSSLPMYAEEWTPEQLEEERSHRKALAEEKEILRRAAEYEAKKDLRVGPEQAQVAKDVLIRVLRHQFRDSYFRRVKGSGDLALRMPPTADQIVQIMDELEKHLVPAGKTSLADWVELSNPGFSHEKYRVTLLTPDFSNSSPDYFHGFKVVNGTGDVAEFKLVSREGAPGWAGLMEQLQTVMADQDAKEASRPKPNTVAWTMERASEVVPRMEVETSLRELHEGSKNRLGTCGGAQARLDLSLVQDRLDDVVIKINEKDISWVMIWTRSADAIGCDVVFGPASSVSFLATLMQNWHLPLQSVRNDPRMPDNRLPEMPTLPARI